MPFKNMFTDPDWAPFDGPGRPNRLWFAVKTGQRLGAVVAVRGAGADWALNHDGLTYVADALAAGRLDAGHVVLAEINAGQSEFVVSLAVSDVVARLRHVAPREGRWGAYFWINRQFAPIGSLLNASAPF